MYGDCSDEDVALATSLSDARTHRTFVTPLDLSERNYGRVPRVYIETLRDNAITLSAQRRMVAAMPCAEVISMNTSHSPFFSAPQNSRTTSLRCNLAAAKGAYSSKTRWTTGKEVRRLKR